MWWWASLATQVSQPRHAGERTRVPGDRVMGSMASWSRAALPLGPTGEGNKLYCLSDHFGSLCDSSLFYMWTNVWTKTRLGKKLISWFQLLQFVSLVRHVAWQILILLYLAKWFSKNILHTSKENCYLKLSAWADYFVSSTLGSLTLA